MKKQKKIIEVDGEKAIKITFPTVVYALLTFVIIIIAVGSILAYGTSSEVGNRLAGKISKIVPFPAAIVDWRHVVYLNDVESNLSSIEKVYGSQNFNKKGYSIDFSTPDGKKKLLIKKREVIDKMVEDQIIETLAKQRGITISQAEVDQAVDTKLNEYGTTENIKEDLLQTYGWTMDEFKQKIVLPGMYADALAKSVMAENITDENAKNKIKAAQNALNSGKDFSEVAKEFSEGSSKNDGGELGWVTKDQVVGGLANTIFSGKQLLKNEIIESEIGYHIVEIENKKKDGETDVLQLRQIFVAKNTFADWLSQQKKKMHVLVPVSGFNWDSNAGMVEFSNPQMTTFEKEVRANAKGEAALLL